MLYTDHITGLDYLCKVLEHYVNTMGTNSNAIKAYKAHVNSIANSIQGVTEKEINIMERLIGMVNTDNVKWNTALKKFNQFKQAINTVLPYNVELAMLIELQQLVATNQLSKSVYKLAIEALQIDINKIPTTEDKLRLIEMPKFSNTAKQILNIDNDKYNKNIALYKNFVHKYSSLIIQMGYNKRNYLDLSDYSDKRYIDTECIRTNVKYMSKYKKLIRELAKGTSDLEIGELEGYGEQVRIDTDTIITSPGKIKTNYQALKDLIDINWEVIYIALYIERTINT